MPALNVQADLIARLAASVPDALVRVSPPAGWPPAAGDGGALVTVRREGGARQDALLDRAGVGIYCWAPTEEGASRLAGRVADLMERLPFGGGYALVEQDFMGSDPDPDSRCPRWYLSYTVTTFPPAGRDDS